MTELKRTEEELRESRAQLENLIGSAMDAIITVDGSSQQGPLKAAIDAVRPAIEAKGISLKWDIERSARLVMADPDRLQQIAWNLLSNAVKFTPEGGSIEVRLSDKNNRVHLDVSDTGVGVTSEFLPFVFDRFRQADSSITRSFGSLGLGLSIMPGEDGYSLIRRVRLAEAEGAKQTPALALSGYARSEDRARALAAGYQMHIAKPIDPLELTNAITKLAKRDTAAADSNA